MGQTQEVNALLSKLSTDEVNRKAAGSISPWLLYQWHKKGGHFLVTTLFVLPSINVNFHVKGNKNEIRLLNSARIF